jgi:predicted membrane protein
MNELQRPPFSPRVLAGLVLVALGILFTLDSFHIVDAGSLGDYWPLFLIVPGIISFVWPRKNADRFWGIILMGVGLLFLFRNLGIFWISFRHVWPVILVALGIYLIWRALEARRESDGPSGAGGGSGQRPLEGGIAGLESAGDLRQAPPTGVDRLNEFAMFGGGDRMIRSSAFRGGNVTAIMGGFDIDLRDAVMDGNAARIEVFVMMGGIDMKVPEGWTVVLDVTPFMGGADYRPGTRRAPAEGPPKVLTVSGFVFMGGIDVKH